VFQDQIEPRVDQDVGGGASIQLGQCFVPNGDAPFEFGLGFLEALNWGSLDFGSHDGD
jgi:hypothetical protein